MIVGQTVVATSDQIVIDESVILADERGMPVYEWSRDATIINKIDIRYGFNEIDLVEGDFAQRRVYVADRSRDIYNTQAIQPFELRGVHDTLGGEDLTDDLALLFMQRWGYAPPLLKLPVTYMMHTLEPGDRVLVTCALMRNPLTGKTGMNRERFEVLNVSPSWLTEGKIDLELLWVGAIESSPIPTKKLSNLLPGVNQFDGTDVPIPLASSVTLTTGVASKFGVGLSRRTYRQWRCDFAVQALGTFPAECTPDGTRTVRQSFTGSVTYRMEYKTVDAPDAPGTTTTVFLPEGGTIEVGDPTTGWVELLAQKTRGSVSQYGDGGCGGNGPGVPSVVFFSEFFDAPQAAPNTYNIQVHYVAVGVQSNPCVGADANSCNPDPFCPGTGSLANSELEADVQAFGVDYLQTVS